MTFTASVAVIAVLAAIALGLVCMNLLNRLHKLETALVGGYELPERRLARRDFETRFAIATHRASLVEKHQNSLVVFIDPYSPASKQIAESISQATGQISGHPDSDFTVFIYGNTSPESLLEGQKTPLENSARLNTTPDAAEPDAFGTETSSSQQLLTSKNPTENTDIAHWYLNSINDVVNENQLKTIGVSPLPYVMEIGFDKIVASAPLTSAQDLADFLNKQNS